MDDDGRGVGVEEILTVPPSPWQNAYAERLIGSIRECLDQVIIANERGLRQVVSAYVAYYLKSRTHLALRTDAPVARPVARPADGRIVAIPHLGGLHTTTNVARRSTHNSQSFQRVDGALDENAGGARGVLSRFAAS